MLATVLGPPAREDLDIRYTTRLSDVGVMSSVGSVADSYDNAMAEALNGTFKAELIHRRGPWRNRAQTEIAIYEWISWYNNARRSYSTGSSAGGVTVRSS